MEPMEWAVLFIAFALLASYAGGIKLWLEHRSWEEVHRGIEEILP
jgi:hypothetical protein